MQNRMTAALIVASAFALASCGDDMAAPTTSANAPAGASAPATAGAPKTAPATGAQTPAAATAAGPTAIPYTALDGTTFTVGEMPGVKVVNYWATWCAPCIKEIPSFNALSAKYKDKGVSFVGVSIDEEGKAVVEPFLKTPKGKIDYRVATARLETLGPVDVTTSIPVTLVYDASNTVVKRFDGFAAEKELEAAIVPALGPAPAK